MQNNQQMGGMQQLDMSQLSNLLRMYGIGGQQIPQMPQQQIPPQMYQMQQPMARMAAPTAMYGQQPQQQMQPSAGLQIPQGYNYDPRTGQQYGMPQGGSNNLQYTYPGGILGSGVFNPRTG